MNTFALESKVVVIREGITCGSVGRIVHFDKGIGKYKVSFDGWWGWYLADELKQEPPSQEAIQYADYILNHYSRDSQKDKVLLAYDLERHGWGK